MFCEKCGHKLKEHDKFCEECGSSTQEDKASHKALKYFEDKAWYRFLKVVYIVVFIVGILFTIGISMSSVPKRNIDSNLSTIKCDSGKVYSLNNANIYLVYSASLIGSDDTHARMLCLYNNANYYNSYFNQNIYKNYTFNPVYTNPDYASWAFYSIIALVIVWSLIKLVKVGVLYIAIGKKPIWKEEFFKHWV